MIGRRFDIRSNRMWKAATLGIVMAAYILFFSAFYPTLGMSIGILAMVPVVAAGWYYGLPGGVGAALLLYPLHVLLLIQLGEPDLRTVVVSRSVLVGHPALVLVGVLAGRLSGLLERINQELAERKRVEESLGESEARYRNVSDLASDWIYSICVNPDGSLDMEWTAGAIERITGYTPEEAEALGGWTKVIHPDDLPKMEARTRTLLSNQRCRTEYRLITKSGEVCWLQNSERPEWDEAQGRVVRIIGAATDITESKRSEEALRQAQTKYRTLVEQVPVIIYISELDGRTIYVSPQIEQITGFSPEEWMADPEIHRKLYHPDDCERVMAGLARSRTTGERFSCEYRIFHRNGHVVWVRDEAVVVRNEEGAPSFLQGVTQDITERKQVEAALRESEARYRNTLDNMMEGCQIIGFDWRYLYLNDSVAKHGRQAREDLLGHTMMEAYPGIEDTEMFPFLRRCMEERIPHRMVNEFVFPDGVRGWFDLSIQPVPEGIFILTLDITERMQAEEEVRRLARFPGENPSPVLQFVRDGTIIYANEVSLPLLNAWGCQVGQTLPDTWRQFAADIFGADAPKTAEVEVEDRTLALTFSSSADADSIIVYGLDITERKQAEETLERERHLLRTLIDHLPDTVYIKDAESRFITVNATALRLLGLETEEKVVGKTDFDFFPRELAEPYYADEREILASGRPMLNKEEPFVDHAGNHRWFSSSKVPLQDGKGAVVGLVGMNRDITESKQAHAALRRRSEELARSNDELNQFAYVASHDLQEPLRKIQTFGDRLQTKYGNALEDEGRDYLARMQNAAGRMRTMITDLLALSRVTSKGQRFVPVALTDIAQEVVSDLEASIKRTGGQVEVEALPTVEADPTQMHQLLQNLIGNGLKFHQEGVKPMVRITCQAADGQNGRPTEDRSVENHCQIMVEDNGIGFDEKYLDRIFQPFQRLHGRNEYEGTGIGLATCKKIIERHNGSITARSVPGQGTTFIVTLPLKQPEEEVPQ